MKLRPTLALLLGLALACGGKDEEDVAPDAPQPPATQPLPPLQPPAAPTTPLPTTPATEGGVVVAPATPSAPAASKAETKRTTKVETKQLQTSVRVQKGMRHEMRPRAEQQLEREARQLGYAKVTNIQLGDVNCGRGNQCTATATGTASREVVVEEEVMVVASEVCPGRFKERAVAEGAQYSCLCSADKISGSVWGNGIYTADSSVCRAAVHAGAIPASGGAVTVKAAPGCGAYSAGKQNGVDSGAWGSYTQSFFFPGYGSGACG